MSKGRVKVIFVDLPIYKLTPLYNRYFLFAANAGSDYRDILKVRRLLFHLADHMSGLKEEHLKNAFIAKGVAFKPFDTKPVKASLNALTKKYMVHSTPTCVILRAGKQEKAAGHHSRTEAAAVSLKTKLHGEIYE